VELKRKQQHWRCIMFLYCSILVCFLFANVESFSANPAGNINPAVNEKDNGFKWFTDIFFNPETTKGNKNDNSLNDRRNQLKLDLLNKCRNDNTGSIDEKRKEIEAIIESLVEIRPLDATASSPLFQRMWLLQWTTEKEINFFYDVGLAADVITQTIYYENENVMENVGVLSNDIPLPGNSNFGVIGALTVPDIKGVRTDFEFSSAKLDLWDGKFSWTLPPIGKGWFDTVYLDDELRVDLNSRDDILICTSK